MKVAMDVTPLRLTRAGTARYIRNLRDRLDVEPIAFGGPGRASVLVREGELVVATRWESLDAVRRFAGESYERAVVEPVVAELLESYDEHVTHYSVAV